MKKWKLNPEWKNAFPINFGSYKCFNNGPKPKDVTNEELAKEINRICGKPHKGTKIYRIKPTKK